MNPFHDWTPEDMPHYNFPLKYPTLLKPTGYTKAKRPILWRFCRFAAWTLERVASDIPDAPETMRESAYDWRSLARRWGPQPIYAPGAFSRKVTIGDYTRNEDEE